jgi:hypothetical protein
MAKEVLATFGVDVDAVSGWLGSYGGEDGGTHAQEGPFRGAA